MLGLNPMEQEIIDLTNNIVRNGYIYFPGNSPFNSPLSQALNDNSINNQNDIKSYEILLNLICDFSFFSNCLKFLSLILIYGKVNYIMHN